MNLKILNKLKAPTGEITWSAPSNLALVKYWGKDNRNNPINPSLSFSLKKSTATTRLKWKAGTGSVSFFLDKQLKPSFYPKIEQFIKRLKKNGLTILKEIDLEIYSNNTFPHSTGIASSASGFSSLSLAILSMFQSKEDDHFWKLASYIASLGSGSAARSTYPGYVSWNGGAAKKVKTSSLFSDLQDAILIVDSSPKENSSSYGHELMKQHPFKKTRIAWASHNFLKLKKILQGTDFYSFAKLVEQEALILHALMMTSSPPLIYMKPNSLKVINIIRKLMNDCPITYTLDAGANIHLLYPKTFDIDSVIRSLKGLLVKIIYDEVGNGPQLLR